MPDVEPGLCPEGQQGRYSRPASGPHAGQLVKGVGWKVVLKGTNVASYGRERRN